MPEQVLDIEAQAAEWGRRNSRFIRADAPILKRNQEIFETKEQQEIKMAKKGVPSKGRRYSDDERKFIAENYGKMPMGELARKFGINVSALQGYACYLRKIGTMPPAPDHEERSAIYWKGKDKPKKNAHHGFTGQDEKHITDRSPQVLKMVRNYLTAQWLGFLGRADNADKTLNQLRADFAEELFKELGI